MKAVAKVAHDVSPSRQRDSLSAQQPLATYAAWKRVRIGDALKLVNGRAFKPSEWSQHGRPIVRIQNLNDPDAPFNYYVGELQAKFGLKKGDLLFAWSGTPGTSFGAHIWRGDDAWLNQHIFRVVFDETQFDKRFLRYAINQNLNQYIAAAHGGAGLAHITKGKFEASTIACPLLDDQRRVVAEIETQFSRLEKTIANLSRVKRQIDGYNDTVRKTAAQGRLITPAIRDSLDKTRGWPRVLAGTKVTWASGDFLPAAEMKPGSIPVYGGNGVVGTHREANVATATLVIGRVGAQCGNVHLTPGPAWVTDNAIYAKSICEDVALAFAAFVFSSAKLRSKSAGSGQPFVNQRILNETVLPVPPLDIQRLIVDEVSRQESLMSNLKANVLGALLLANQLRQAILDRAFDA